MVPFSYSRAITMEVSSAPTNHDDDGDDAGNDEVAALQVLVDQTRMRPSTGAGSVPVPGGSVVQEVFFVGLGDEGRDEGPGVAGRCGSLPSITTCSGLARSALSSALQPGGDDDAETTWVAVEQVRERGGERRVGDQHRNRPRRPAVRMKSRLSGSSVVVDHRRGDVFHVQADARSEKQDQEHRE